NDGYRLSRRWRLLECFPGLRSSIIGLRELDLVAATERRDAASGSACHVYELLHAGCSLALHEDGHAGDHSTRLHSHSACYGFERTCCRVPPRVEELAYSDNHADG